MSNRLKEVSDLFLETQGTITDNIQNWQNFLTTASRLSKYNFNDQLLIFAQRPNATACANMELWNKKMNRWIKTGSKGIALIRKNTGEKPRLEYVFDFADTRQLQHGKTPYLWKMREEFHAPLTEKLSQMYGEISPNNDFANTLMEYCARATGENYREFLHDLTYDLEDSFLEGFDEMNVDVAFRNVITVSTQYMILSRCGFNPMNYLDEDDFRGIFEFNTLEVLSHLGNALNRVSGELLRAISDVARNIDLEKSRHSLENPREITYTKTKEKFTTLNQSSENIEEEENHEQHTYLQSERGLSHSKPTNSRGQFTGNSGKIRDAQGNPPERPQEWHLHENDDAGHPVGTLGGDRPNSTGTGGWIDGANDDSTGRKRELESPGSDALGADGNEHQSTGGGNRAEGIDLQLTPQEPSLFPTVLQQINTIIEAKAEEQSSVFSLFDTLPIPSHVIDKIIAAGSNELRDTPIIAGYMAYNHEISENAAYIAFHYGTGGKGFEIDGEKYSLWYDKNGLQIGRGNTAELATSKIHLTWEQVASHIRGLLETGEYVTADELATSKDSYLTRVAESYSYMYRDKDDDYHNEILDNIVSHFIYPECTNIIKNHFADKNKLPNMVLGLQQMDTDHKNAEGGIMRFRHYSPEKTLFEIRNLGNEPVEFPSTPDFKRLEPTFITEDELNHIYIPSSRRIDTGCIDIYAFYKQGHTDKEKADFLKNKHGWTGYGVSNVNINHSAKGTTYTKGSLTNPYAEVSENWAQIAKRIGKLIAENRYLKQQYVDYIPTYEKQLIAREIHTFYSYAPKDAEKPYTIVQDGTSFQYSNYEKNMKEIAAQLDEPQFVADLAEKMENILSHTLSDERGFESMEKALSDVKAFRDGSYSIFRKTEYKPPEKDLEDNEDFDEPREPSIEQMAKKLERKRQTPFMQNDYGQLSLDFSSKNDEESEIITEDEMESETAFDFDNGSLESSSLFPPVIEPQKPHIIADNTPKINYIITDDALGTGGTKEKFNRNTLAIETLQKIETENRLATPEEQESLSQYVGWGGMPEAFDDSKPTWSVEYATLKNLLSAEEYKSARASTLNAHYTPPVVIRSMYEALNNMGIPQDGNFIDPALGTGHFIGMLPENFKNGKMYGTELDSLTGRIAKQLYPNADIQIKGYEKANYPDNFFDVAVGNVPFGNYKLNDKRYDKQNFLIHDYFFAKTLDKVRVGGVVAFITSKGTMDKQSSEVRNYLAQRADLLGAIRLPNTAFKANAGTEVTSDILFFQKRDHAPEVLPSWVDVMENADGIPMNQYFIDNPQMIMGKMEMVSGPFGMESTCTPHADMSLADQLKIANTLIRKPDTELLNQKSHNEETDKNTSIAATADVRNFSYTLIDDKVYYRENSRMNPVTLSDTAFDRLKALIAIRDKTRDIIEMQLDECSDERLHSAQAELNTLYDSYNKKFGLINSKGSKSAFVNDVSYPLLCSLEKLDEDGNLAGKADMFTKRTIKQGAKITSVDTPSEALAVSISEKACVDILFMSQLLGGADKTDVVIEELKGVIFKDPLSNSEDKLSGWQTADEYLSGNVREKLAIATLKAENNPDYAVNVEMLTKVQPKDLSASEIDVRIGATWIEPKYYSQFLYELLGTPRYLQGNKVDIKYSKHTGEWNISGKNEDRVNPKGYATYGTKRKNAYAIIEDSLNLRDSRIYDTVIDDDGKEKRVLNGKETTLAQQKQEAISEAFKEWIWKDPERREVLAKEYNKIYNSTRPREFDGQHIKFDGMTPTIRLNPHQSNAVARTLYGGNTLLAHCVGAGKTYTMIASAMESKRLGLSQKSLFVVPNHLTEQMGSDIYELYPGAKVLVATKKDFEPANRKEFCSRIATGDFDIVVIGHSQFEKIPLSVARQEAIFEKQIEEIMFAIQDAKAQNGERYTIKQLEKTQKSLETRLEKLSSQEKKDSVVTFEELGVDKLYVDEGHMFKNLFLQTKMRNVAGIGQSEAQKSTDMFTKCRYMDELTGGKGTIFATGTPVSNSMTELYTMMRYLQYSTLERLDLIHFDSWAANFGEKVTAIELAPEGTGFRAKTRFAKFFNLPELINIWKEASDIQTADMLNLEVPIAEHITVVTKPSEFQVDMVKDLAERANSVRKREVEPNVDNMLRITSDGRKLALDQRLHNDMLPDNPDSKINKCIENVLQIWEETAPTKGTQLIFCDLSTPHNDGTFNVYDDIKNKLMEKGVPSEEIAFIHDANTETQKAELFAKVRKGSVRVLLGSTQKMGAGTNVQTKLVALHHTDCPWRPADLEQREGRIIRQKNENKNVKIFKYVTENTFDAYNWSLIENKQRFIGQIFTSKSPVRSADDIDATALSYAEVKALATGDTRIKEKMDLDIQVAKLKLMRSSHNSQRYEMEDRVIKYYPAEIKKTTERIEGLKADTQIVKSHPVGEENFFMTVQGQQFTDRKLAGEAIIEACKQVKNPDEKIALGEYRGFPMTLSMDSGKFHVSMKQAVTHIAELENNVTGNIARINNALEAMPKNIETLTDRLERLGDEMTSAKMESERPFPKEDEYQEKNKRLAELNILLDNADKEEPSGEKDVSHEKSDTVHSKEKPSVLQALKTLKATETDRDKSVPGKLLEAR